MGRAMVAALVWILVGCAMPHATRTADPIAPGNAMLGPVAGGTFGTEKLPDATPLELMGNYGVSGQIGVVKRCDLTLMLTVPRIGVLFRCGVLSERLGQPLSLSPGVGVSYLPMRGFETSATVDVSAELGGGFSPLATFRLKHGGAFYAVPREGYRHIEQSAWRLKDRKETRFEVNLGVAGQSDSQGGGSGDFEFVRFALGLAPYWILNADELSGVSSDGPHGVNWTFHVGMGL